VKASRLFSAALAAGSLALFALPAGAVVTATWTVETYQQFDAGDATSAFITSAGELRPGWDTKRTALEGDAIWSSVRLVDGSVLLGSDVGGAIYRLSGDSSKKVVSLPGAIAVVALVQTADGSVWAGAMPGNKLFKIDVAGGKATAGPQLGTPKDVETIWSLAASGNTVYAGTGPSGKLFAITGGNAKEVFDTDDKRITALAVTSDGNVWMGTSERALVFRYDPKDNKARAMADFAGNEVSALAPYRDGVVVAANDLADAPAPVGKTSGQVEAAEKPTAAKGQATKLPDAGTKPGADKDPSPVVDLGRKGAKKGKGALFRIGSDGRLDQLHALTQTYFTSVVASADAIYAGAADKGRVYMVDADGSVATAFDVDERSVSQLWLEKNLVGFATDDAAAAYRATGRASQARYVSDVLDAKAVARFGKLAWVSQGKVKLETRSGNTAKPGVGWSEWQAPGQVAKLGGGNEGGKIVSPPGRYLQWRVALEDDVARVRRVTGYYVPQNQATQVQDVTVELATKDSLPTLKDSAAKPRSPVLKLKWKVENPDSDETTYALEARRDGEANWRPISTGKAPLTATTWDWNTETYPDGWYRVRVTASDAAANSPDRALTSSASSTMFAIDNSRPAINGLTVNYPKANARASDSISTINEAAFSVDDGPWQLGTTADGLYDDLTEDLRIDLPAGLSRGTHTLAVRAADASGNVGSTSTTFVVK
jgi:hypothetical protein